jgi:hypothetical protein
MLTQVGAMPLKRPMRSAKDCSGRFPEEVACGAPET